MVKKVKSVVKEITWKVYQQESEKYYSKAFVHFMIIVCVVALTFMIG